MRKLFTNFLIVLFVCAISIEAFSQNGMTEWSINWDYPKSFIENKGQFDGRDKQLNSDILYAVDHGPVQVFFTKEGVIYRLDNKLRNPDKSRKKGERPKLICYSDFIYMTFEGTNPQTEIVAENAAKDYHTYSMLKDDWETYYDIRDIRGFEKITYKNLYPGIDVLYEFHPESGIKYSLILAPGADPSQFKMQYTSDRSLNIDNDGNLRINTLYGDIIEKAPLTFYTHNTYSVIGSRFVKEGNTVSFQLDAYNNSQSITIDPWVQTPTLSNSNGVWELDIDGAGNVYTIGGDMPMRLQKWNSAGALQWTYNTPWDTANFWLGTLTVDMAGNSYITAGASARLQKVNTTGSMEYSVNGHPMDEYWNITFNCDHTRLVIGGTRLNPIDLANSNGVIFDIDITNGNVISLQEVAGTRPGPLGIFDEPNEVRALSPSREGRYYYLTLEETGCINHNFTVCTTNDPIFHIDSDYIFAYKSENYRPNNGNSGMRAIKAGLDFYYTHNGAKIEKRSLVDGSVITSVTIPGGISTSSMGFNQPGNSGIAIDDCGNVYVGSSDRVVKYDENLNFISEETLSYRVFDVAIGNNGRVIVCGATGNSSSTSRTGYLQSINMSACGPFDNTCCLTSICPEGPFCHDDAPVTLITEVTGGTFSGTGVNPSTGVFDPANAGPGTHNISYTLSCGSGSINITVNYCVPLNVCAENNGDITVSAGMGPYTWEEWVPAGSTPITSQAECVACGYTWVPLMNQCLDGTFPVTTCDAPAGWAQFATGSTITPSGTYPIQVTDSQGNTTTINDFASLPECLPCPTVDINTTNIANAACIGGSDGSFTASASGGTGPYSYTLTLGGNTITTFSNVTGPQNFTGLAAGNYTLNVVDIDGCPGSTTVTIGEDPFTVAATSNSPVCEGQTISFTASGGSVYNWAGPGGFSSNAQNPSITNVELSDAGTYYVTISSPPCIDSVSFDVIVNPSPTADAGIDQTITYGQSIQLDGSGGGTYAWYPTATLDNPNIQNPMATPVATTTYILTVTNTFNCSASDSVTITIEHITGEIFVPNIFSPNSSNHDNSMVYVYGPNIKEMQFFIYNRWGEKVFESNKQSQGWDGTYKGKPANPGVFTYYLEVIFLDDTEETLTGNITLVR